MMPTNVVCKSLCVGGILVSLIIGPCVAISTAEETAASDAQWNTDFADGLFIRGMYAAAIKEYTTILQEVTDEAVQKTLSFKIAEAYFKKEAYADAIAHFSAYAEQYPDDQSAMVSFYVSVSHYFESDYEKARTLLEAITREKLSADTLPLWHYYYGLTLHMLEDYDGAIEALGAVQDTEDLQIRSQALQKQAISYSAKGDLDYASKTLETLVQEYPEHGNMAKVHLALGKNYFEACDFQRSLESFRAAENATVTDEDRLLLTYGIIKNLFQLERVDEVVTYSETLLDAELDDVIRKEIQYIYGSALFQQKNFAQALNIFDAIIDKNSDSLFVEQALLQGLWVCYESDDLKKFSKYLSKFTDLFPDSLLLAEGFFLRGELFFADEKYDKALKEYARALERNPAFRYAPYVQFQRAMTLKKSGDIEQAFEGFHTFVQLYANTDQTENALLECIMLGEELDKKDIVLECCTAYIEKYVGSEAIENIFMKKAQMEHALERFDAMKETFDHMLVAFPDTEKRREILFYTGEYYERRKEYKDAIVAYNEALLYDAGATVIATHAITLRLAVTHYLNLQYDLAQEKLFVLIEANTMDIPLDMKLWVGDYWGEHEQYDKALRVYEGLVKADIADESKERVMYKLASWQFARNDWEQAHSLYRSFIDAYPESDLVLFSRLGIAECYERMGDTEKARELYGKLATTQVPFVKARAHNGLGNIYYSQGNLEEAVRSYMFVTILFDDALVADLLVKVASIWIELDNTENALAVLNEFDERFPDHALKQEAAFLREQLATPAPESVA